MFKKMTSLLLALVLLFTMAPAAFAAEETADYEMEQYFILTNAGTIYFDTATAMADGVDQDYIAFVQENINTMNHLVECEDAYITNDFRAVLCSSRTRTLNGGETKTEYDWDGSLLIYLNSDDTETLIDELQTGGAAGGLLLRLFGQNIISGFLTGLNLLTIAQLQAANRDDTGVVIKVKPNFDTGGQDVYIRSQG